MRLPVDTLSARRRARRVILLSDGNANEGLTDPGEIASQCEAFAAAGVSTSTYGFGRHFNEELMVAMARAGGGNSYYGDTADDLFEPFDQEFSLLSSLWARAPRRRTGTGSRSTAWSATRRRASRAIPGSPRSCAASRRKKAQGKSEFVRRGPEEGGTPK